MVGGTIGAYRDDERKEHMAVLPPSICLRSRSLRSGTRLIGYFLSITALVRPHVAQAETKQCPEN